MTWLQGLLWVAFSAWASFGLWLLLSQRRLVFQPGRQTFGLPPRLLRLSERVELPSPAATITGFYLRASEQVGQTRRAYLFLPGSIGDVSHELASLEFLLSTGVDVFTIDYPGYGHSSGRPSERGFYQAADLALRHLTEERGLAAENVVVVGRSLGSVLALRLAARARVAGIVVQGGFVSVREIAAQRYPYFPSRLLCFIAFDARDAARRVQSPALFVHGKDDQRVPEKLGRGCFELMAAPKRFLRIAGGHAGENWTLDSEVRRRLDELWNGEALKWPC